MLFINDYALPLTIALIIGLWLVLIALVNVFQSWRKRWTRLATRIVELEHSVSKSGERLESLSANVSGTLDTSERFTCYKCGRENLLQARYCGSCGTNLRARDVPVFGWSHVPPPEHVRCGVQYGVGSEQEKP